MTALTFLGLLGSLTYVALLTWFIARAILRPHREPASRIAWITVLLVLPLAGMVAYTLLGETHIGRRRAARRRRASNALVAPGAVVDPSLDPPGIPDRFVPLFQAGRSVNGFEALGGNRAMLMADAPATVDALVADIDAATSHAHLSFYIWLPDNSGQRVAQALCRAASRGVACRAMVDALGSRRLIGSPHWRDMQEAGVKLATALPIGNPLLRPLLGRIDLRNHRKIVVIDNRITYCGSWNCADPEFRIKPKFAPWVDAMMRFDGSIARQNQHLFLTDWMSQVPEDLSPLLLEPPPSTAGIVTAQVIGTGPTVRYSAMPEVFETLLFSARRELVISTPYYVPGESTQAALCACARRGVVTKVVFPARNDSRIVAAASRSYYADLLASGVEIYEYRPGLLHTKSLTVDGEITLIGSANLDRRSFELNYENNILLCDADLTAAMRRRQETYLADSNRVTPEEVASWPVYRRLWNNAVAMLGPVL
jgi:cardiolipin synthase A/B